MRNNRRVGINDEQQKKSQKSKRRAYNYRPVCEFKFEWRSDEIKINWRPKIFSFSYMVMFSSYYSARWYWRNSWSTITKPSTDIKIIDMQMSRNHNFLFLPLFWKLVHIISYMVMFRSKLYPVILFMSHVIPVVYWQCASSRENLFSISRSFYY